MCELFIYDYFFRNDITINIIIHLYYLIYNII